MKIKLYIARDRDDTLTVFEKKPSKNMGSWTTRNGDTRSMFINEDLFPEIKWEDKELRILECELK